MTDGGDSPGLHTVESELALLGALMVAPEAAEVAFDILRPEAFYDPVNGTVFGAAAALWRSGKHPRPEFIRDALGADPGFAAAGGIKFLGELVDRAPWHADPHAHAIVDYYTRRELVRLALETHGKAADTSYASAADVITEIETALTNIVAGGAPEGGLRALGLSIDATIQRIEEAGSKTGALVGLPTGLIDLDKRIGGLAAANLLILAARPSMGKSALALIIAYYLARQGKRVAFFSLEMSTEELQQRLISYITGIPFDRMKKGDCSFAEYGRIREAGDDLRSLPLFIDETGAVPLAKIASRSRRMKRTAGLDLIVVDYLQLITVDRGRSSDSRTQEVSQITQGLKALAKDLQLPVLALSQLSRALESRQDKRPMLSDLRDSGSIEQDADVVMFVYREAYYVGRSEPPPNSDKHGDWLNDMEEVRGKAEVIVAKQRQGPIGTVHLHFNDDLARFENAGREGWGGPVPARSTVGEREDGR